MIISHSHKFIYFHAPKTAGTSVEDFLWSLCNKEKDVRGIKGWEWDVDGEKIRQHTSVKIVEKEYPKIFNEYFTIGNIRNTWDREVSQYYYNKKRSKNKQWLEYTNLKNGYYDPKESFENFSRRGKGSGQINSLVDFYGNTKLDFFIRFESLEKDLRSMLNLLNINKQIRLTNKNASRRDRDYRKYYNETTIKLVEEKRWKDIKAFGYTF